MSKASDLARLMTSGSTAVHGEAGVTSSGSTGFTTNLQQGLAKAWLNTNQASINDSLNFASVTDNGTGNYTSTFTNAMNNSSYAVSISSNMGSGNGGFNGTGSALSTASVNNYSYTDSGSFRDVNPLYYLIAGDLA
tara:strand:- start:46 stop:453 length:408 start_codon:yes stop_codon:yes gene_type:complete